MKYTHNSRVGEGEKRKAMARNDEIQRLLQRDHLKAQSEIPILLLGAEESDHSALSRQMRLVHHGGYNTNEREEYKPIIFSKIINDMRAVLEAMPQLGLKLASTTEALRATVSSLLAPLEVDVLPPDVAGAVRNLCRDPGVKEAMNRGREFKLSGDALYYFTDIDRIAAASYIPTDEDILRSQPKTGIEEIAFQVGDLTYRMFVPHDQPSEWRKWIHCFENVEGIVFCASLSNYDQTLCDEGRINRLQKALTMFDSIVSSRWFVETSIMLCLNVDSLAEKLPRSPLAGYFPDYTGGDNFDAACDYLLHRFMSLNPNPETKQIFGHFSSVEDNQQVKFILSAIQDILLQKHLRK
ncbi:heterotrimeric G-protein alpha subunit, GPA1-like protein [Mycena haematopus]|nr:heterotrimeric G-protein alpha subunit, GPA1-like protein [Mycena haematopus]